MATATRYFRYFHALNYNYQLVYVWCVCCGISFFVRLNLFFMHNLCTSQKFSCVTKLIQMVIKRRMLIGLMFCFYQFLLVFYQIGHRKLRAFVTHGGLLSMFESVYHGVPLVTMPVFCDHDVNAAKAVADGYALRLELETLTSDKLSKPLKLSPSTGLWPNWN